MQQSGAAEVRILTKNLYKFEIFWGKKLIRKFSDKGWYVKCLSELLKKLQDSGSMTRQTESGQCRSMCILMCR